MNRILRSPAQYVQGKGVLGQLGDYLKDYHGGALVILSESGKKRFGTLIAESFVTGACPVMIESFGGECTRTEVERLAQIAKKERLDIVVGVGGGKVLDTAKGAAHSAGIAAAVVPTAASTDAPCSSLAVLYCENGEFDAYLYLKNCPELVLVDTTVISKAPARLLTAGMGDALATYFEARACKGSGKKNQLGTLPTTIATEIAALCWKHLKASGAAAKTAIEAGACTEAVEIIVEVNTYLSSVGFESGGLAAAHAIQKGFTHIPELHQVYHGEKVAFCTVTQLILENAPKEELQEVLEFCCSVGLPVSFADMGYTEREPAVVRRAAEMACVPGSTVHNMPFEVTPDAVYAALLAADAAGLAFKKAQRK